MEAWASNAPTPAQVIRQVHFILTIIQLFMAYALTQGVSRKSSSA